MERAQTIGDSGFTAQVEGEVAWSSSDRRGPNDPAHSRMMLLSDRYHQNIRSAPGTNPTESMSSLALLDICGHLKDWVEPDFIIVPQPDPLMVLRDAFPELLNDLDDEEKDLGPYYVYGRLVDYLARQRSNEQLWKRADALFDSLALGGPTLEDLLVIEVFEGMYGHPDLMSRLKSNLGSAARKLLEDFLRSYPRPCS